MDLDVERAGAQIDRLIERRAEQDQIESEWAEQATRLGLADQRQRRQQWARHHLDLARLFSALAAEHEEKGLRLIDEGAT